MLENFQTFFNTHWPAVVLIIIVALLTRRFGDIVVTRLVRQSMRPDRYKTEADEKQREQTLVGILTAVLQIGIWIIAVLLILSEFGVNIAPLIAGAGIAGVALGFGAQSLVKDFLAGIFIITENQYRVGDVVQINESIAGVVEHLSLRETVLRDLDGMVHHVSNGNITIATNMTMDYANVNLDIGVDYASDLDKVEKIINDVGKSLTADEAWGNKIIETPQMLRVDDFAESAIIIKIVGKTLPMQQWAVTGELRKRLKKDFDKHDIAIPFPQRVIHQQKK